MKSTGATSTGLPALFDIRRGTTCHVVFAPFADLVAGSWALGR